MKLARRLPVAGLIRPVLLVAAVLLLLPLVLLPLYGFVNPPVTTVMLFKAVGGNGIHKEWRDLSHISPNLVRAVIGSEDQRFCSHNGIDWTEMQNALDTADRHGRMRGASTITMQVVKNLFLSTSRSWLLKGMQFPLALYADLVLSKRRIMEIYLNIVEWDEGIYGAEAASQGYFRVAAAKLSAAQAAGLAATLPNPLARNPAHPSRRMRGMANKIARRAATMQPYVGCVLK
ncbi:monofunctional biosynthetic peptidoglycan transglycosylase [Faunimonas pinastri]|uniref:Biosynthetic peptidoglycan transglycosylase n=1 Tax=Faunimonas pinastri TaxID=1855383 RepID=A0A1H9HVF6_9HYPH|nr:monofunctional biosynthetic peptidoglycan transglycosylase [Faunimonas pinastri]SEQ66212.1 monofunctional biosynthetic peptidoglycan transglycosylase [Faunimonas pinastri]